MGYDSMMSCACDAVFWARQLADKCNICQRHQQSNQKEPLVREDDSGRPGAKVGADFFF